jgi:hypothetical protein
MTLKVISEQEILQEGLQVLMTHTKSDSHTPLICQTKINQ